MKLKAFLAGILLFALTSIPLVFLEFTSPLITPLAVSIYGIGGFVLGYYWAKGWRLGLWLIAFDILLTIPSGLFGGPVEWDFKREMVGLASLLMLVVAACLGTELGAILKRRQAKTP